MNPSHLFQIEYLSAREVLDSRGFPTVEVEMKSGKHKTSAIVPSGASTGEGEALELRDQDASRFLGKGVLKAVENVNQVIAPALIGKSFASPALLDDLLLKLDGTANKSKLGANALLPVSMCYARMYALQTETGVSPDLALVASISKQFQSSGRKLPVPLMNVINGGKHADNGLAIQEFMIVPHGFPKFSDALRAGTEVFHHLKKILTKMNLTTAVGDEGGFAPKIESHERVLVLLLEAIAASGYKAGAQISLALDCAASEFATKNSSQTMYDFEGVQRTSDEMIEIYERWCQQYPIVSIEDGLHEHDWSGWRTLTERLGKSVQLVGDDLFVTNPEFLKKGIEQRAANALLVKLNQIGTVTETLEAMKLAREHHYSSVVSHRSGESEDTFIADLAVATDSGQIKTGSASRSDRIAKYNQLLRLENYLGSQAVFQGWPKR